MEQEKHAAAADDDDDDHLRRKLGDVRVRVLVQFGTLLRRHREGIGDGARDLLVIVRVDTQAAGAECLRGAGKLGEHEDALGRVLVTGLAGDVLVGDQVHAVAEGGDDADGGDGVPAK